MSGSDSVPDASRSESVEQRIAVRYLVTGNLNGMLWTHIIFKSSSSNSIASYLSETLDVLKRLVATVLHQNQMMPSRVKADGIGPIGPTTKEKEYGRTDYRLTIYLEPVE